MHQIFYSLYHVLLCQLKKFVTLPEQLFIYTSLLQYHTDLQLVPQYHYLIVVLLAYFQFQFKAKENF